MLEPDSKQKKKPVNENCPVESMHKVYMNMLFPYLYCTSVQSFYKFGQI